MESTFEDKTKNMTDDSDSNEEIEINEENE